MTESSSKQMTSQGRDRSGSTASPYGSFGDPAPQDRLRGKGDIIIDAPEATEAAMPLLSSVPLVVTGGGAGWTQGDDRKAPTPGVGMGQEPKLAGRSLKEIQQSLKALWGDEDPGLKVDKFKKVSAPEKGGSPKGVSPEEALLEELEEEEDAHLTGSLEEVAEELRWRMEVSAAWEAERM